MAKLVVAALIVKNGKLLVVDNIKYSLRVEPPGGKLEDGETVKQALIREAREELALSIEPIRQIGVYQTFSPEGDYKVDSWLCEITAGEPTITEPEKINNFHWLGWDELLQTQELVPNLKEALADIKSLLV